MVARAGLIADSSRFQTFIFGVIAFNAMILGLETYDGVRAEVGGLLTVLNDTCLGIFVVGWNEVLADAQAVHSWSWIFFISFVLIASLLLINILIAIIINAMEEAREFELDETIEQRRHEAEEAGVEYDEKLETAIRIKALKQAVEDLEQQLGIETGEAKPKPRVITRGLGGR